MKKPPKMICGTKSSGAACSAASTVVVRAPISTAVAAVTEPSSVVASTRRPKLPDMPMVQYETRYTITIWSRLSGISTNMLLRKYLPVPLIYRLCVCVCVCFFFFSFQEASSPNNTNLQRTHRTHRNAKTRATKNRHAREHVVGADGVLAEEDGPLGGEGEEQRLRQTEERPDGDEEEDAEVRADGDAELRRGGRHGQRVQHVRGRDVLVPSIKKL